MKDGRISTFTLGDCVAEYLPETQKLNVFTDVEHFKLVYHDLTIEGNQQDYFEGTVSESDKTWTAERVGFFDFGKRFPMDPNKIGVPDSIVFKKIEEEKTEK